MIEIRAIIFKDGDHWVGQCLEYDIAAHANDLETVGSRLVMTIEAEAEIGGKDGGNPFEGIDPAPKYFHDLWNKRGTEFRRMAVIKDAVSVEQAIAA